MRPFQDLIDERCGVSVQRDGIRPIEHQAPCFRELRSVRDRRYTIFCREFRDARALSENGKKRLNDQTARAFFTHRREGAFDFLDTCDHQRLKPYFETLGSVLCLLYEQPAGWVRP